MKALPLPTAEEAHKMANVLRCNLTPRPYA
jgi:hypothetical protein